MSSGDQDSQFSSSSAQGPTATKKKGSKKKSAAATASLPSLAESSNSSTSCIYPFPRRPHPRGECHFIPSHSSSHTQYFRREEIEKDQFVRINSDIYCGATETITGTSESYECEHGPGGKKYSKKGQLKRNLLKNIDPVKTKPAWSSDCPPVVGWELASRLVYLIKQPKEIQSMERILEHLHDFCVLCKKGIKFDVLDDLLIIIEYLVDNVDRVPELKKHFVCLLERLSTPILLNSSSEAIKSFQQVRNFIGYLGYLTMELYDDDLFDLVSNALIFHLSCPDKHRGLQGVRLRHTLVASRKILVETIVHNIALALPRRFPTFLFLAFILAADNVENCVDFLMANIIENIFYRFNPYFPDRDLPVYDINPRIPKDINCKLGQSTVHMKTVISLLLVLLKTAKDLVDSDPKYKKMFPAPDDYSQRCFIWAYRFECRNHPHHHERCSLTLIAEVMLHVYGTQLTTFYYVLMPDVMRLSVFTELPLKDDWTKSIEMGYCNNDVIFKKYLIKLSCYFLRTTTTNRMVAVDFNWVVGLIYLIDPGLSSLRPKWNSVMYADVRKTALQALVCTIDKIPHEIVLDINLIRRLLWYIEWYTESPYEISLLYWTLRVLQTSLFTRKDVVRKAAVKQLLITHGIIILMQLCDTLMELKYPPTEMTQAVIGLTLRVITSTVEMPCEIRCIVYPHLRWPQSVNLMVKKMMRLVLSSLMEYYTVSDRWLVSLINFIWEAVVWNKKNRDKFIENRGIYHLLDIITITRYPVQCIALAVICDIVRAGDAVGQLVTWRATFRASNAYPVCVNRGANIATLIAAIFKRDTEAQNIRFDENNVIQDVDFPMMSMELKKYIFAPRDNDSFTVDDIAVSSCAVAADLLGSRTSKCFAILHMLSEDLEYKVALADEAYHLYKDVEMNVSEECILLLCSYYLTLLISDVWLEIQVQNNYFLPNDSEIMDEFLHIGRGWAKYIQQQQLEIVEKHNKKEQEKERSFYSFLEKVRLNVALDALRDVRAGARSTDRDILVNTLIYEAVKAFHRRSLATRKLTAFIQSTYDPPLDENVQTYGTNLKIINIPKKSHHKKREILGTDKSDSEDERSPDPVDEADVLPSHHSRIASVSVAASKRSHTSKLSVGSKGSKVPRVSVESQASFMTLGSGE